VSNAIVEYTKLSESLAATDGMLAGQMFGKPCLKINGKAFLAQHQEFVVFKLTGQEHQQALAMKGARLWDPSGKGRPMKEWIAIPGDDGKLFNAFAAAAMQYVSQG
jgi:hypothetical protein